MVDEDNKRGKASNAIEVFGRVHLLAPAESTFLMPWVLWMFFLKKLGMVKSRSCHNLLSNILNILLHFADETTLQREICEAEVVEVAENGRNDSSSASMDVSPNPMLSIASALCERICVYHKPLSRNAREDNKQEDLRRLDWWGANSSE